MRDREAGDVGRERDAAGEPDAGDEPGAGGAPDASGASRGRDVVRQVREAFVEAGWTVDGVLDLLGPGGWAALGRDERVPAARALRLDAAAAGSPGGLLTRLFLLREVLSPGTVTAVLPVAELQALGLVERHGDSLVAALDVRPYGETDSDWYVVSDLDGSAGAALPDILDRPIDLDRARHGDSGLRADHVLGVGGASLTLAGLVPRLPRRTAIDVGTGCGVQALHLSRHVDRVVATDTNPRALHLCSLTWGLSGLAPERLDLRKGSLLEPLTGQRADLLVSNPPFVVSPGLRVTYRDAGLRGDELGRLLLEQAPAHLEDDGWCVLLANWLHQKGRDWHERVAAWAEPAMAAGCDVWVAEREALDVARYAENWLADAGDHLGAEYAHRYDEWLASFEADGVEAVGMGWVVLHRAGREQPWLRVDDVADAVRRPDGDEVVARMRAATATEGLPAVALLGARLRVAPGVVVEEATGYGDAGRSFALPARVRLAHDAGGWRAPTPLDATGLALVRGCDGTRSVADVVGDVAAATGADVDEVAVLALHLLRGLVDTGVLAPA